MKVYCINRFKLEVEELKKKKQYSGVEEEIIDYFLNKNIDEVSSGARLNHCLVNPFVKKRLEGSGGYRIYYLLLVKNDSVYLTFVHPKTGPKGADNITDEAKKTLYREVCDAITDENLFEVTSHPEKKEIFFTPVEKKEKNFK